MSTRLVILPMVYSPSVAMIGYDCAEQRTIQDTIKNKPASEANRDRVQGVNLHVQARYGGFVIAPRMFGACRPEEKNSIAMLDGVAMRSIKQAHPDRFTIPARVRLGLQSVHHQCFIFG